MMTLYATNEDGLTAGDLIMILRKVPPKTKIVVHNLVVQGIGSVSGRISEGYYSPTFKEVPEDKSRDTVISFGVLNARSDGAVEIIKL